MCAQISLSLLSFHFQKKCCFTSSDLLALLRQGKLQHLAFDGVMKECCLLAKYMNDKQVKKGTLASRKYLLEKDHIIYLSKLEQEL